MTRFHSRLQAVMPSSWLLRLAICTAGVYLLMVAMFTAMKLASAGIPPEMIKDNSVASLKILAGEGEEYIPVGTSRYLKADNFTDAIMIGACLADADTLSSYQRVLYSPVFEVDFTRPIPAQILESATHPATAGVTQYCRYWHGYDVTLRPLLTLMDYFKLRVLNYILLFSLAVWAAIRIRRIIGATYAAAFIGALLLASFPTVPLTLQYTTCHIISLAAILTVLYIPARYLRQSDIPGLLLLFCTGGTTSFLDLLTTPLITLGMPLIFLLLRRGRFPDWKFVTLGIAMWCQGYASIWSTKWILVWLSTPFDILTNVSVIAGYRSDPLYLEAIPFPTGKILRISAVFLLVSGSCAVALTGRSRQRAERYLPLLAIGLLPFGWIAIMQQHSFIHFFFVWRIFMTSIYATAVFLLLTFSRKSHPVTGHASPK